MTEICRAAYGPKKVILWSKHTTDRSALPFILERVQPHIFATGNFGNSTVCFQSLHESANCKPRHTVTAHEAWHGILFEQSLGKGVSAPRTHPWEDTFQNRRSFLQFRCGAANENGSLA